VKKITLGRTNILTNKVAFGALPIQRASVKEAVYILQKARDAGIDFYDTARGYTDSEEKLGLAFGGSPDVFIATKNSGKTGDEAMKMLDESLRLLKRDYVDIFQFHNPRFLPRPDDGTGLYEAALAAQAAGKIRHIGISQHSHVFAMEAALSGLYDSLQYPLSYLSDDTDLKIMHKCIENNVGFIVMKAMAGGLIANAAASFAYLDQFDILPIWGIQRESELDEFIEYIDNPPIMNPDLQAVIDNDRNQLAHEFCRGCGYCLPCPVNIPINMAARMSLFLRRSPAKSWLTEESQATMANILKCTKCGYCTANCPYDLDVTDLLKRNYEDYLNVVSGKTVV